MTELHFTASFEAEFKKLLKGNSPLKSRVAKQLKLLLQNPQHPSLRLHKITTQNCFSISVDKSIRILILFESGKIYVYHIGKHEDVY